MQSDFCVATHALVCLAHTKRAWKSRELAQNIRTTAPRVRKVLSALAPSGMVASKEGIDGGYVLARGPETITLGDVAETLGIRCVSLSWESGGTDPHCIVSSGMGQEMRSIAQSLDDQCKRFLKRITIQRIVEDLRKHPSDLLQEKKKACRPVY